MPLDGKANDAQGAVVGVDQDRDVVAELIRDGEVGVPVAVQGSGRFSSCRVREACPGSTVA